MRTTARGTFEVLSLLALVCFLSLGPAVAAAGQAAPGGPPAAQAQAQKPEKASGELRSVDTAKKTLTISAGGGAQQVFQYTDDTKVTGASGGVAGLATMSGRQVTIEFTMKGADRVATSIEVAAAK
jgi:Cu/Ag efflux protein CusF